MACGEAHALAVVQLSAQEVAKSRSKVLGGGVRCLAKPRLSVMDVGSSCDSNADCWTLTTALLHLQARQALFSWGKGLAGQLGTGRFSDQLVPKRVRWLWIFDLRFAVEGCL